MNPELIDSLSKVTAPKGTVGLRGNSLASSKSGDLFLISGEGTIEYASIRDNQATSRELLVEVSSIRLDF